MFESKPRSPTPPNWLTVFEHVQVAATSSATQLMRAMIACAWGTSALAVVPGRFAASWPVTFRPVGVGEAGGWRGRRTTCRGSSLKCGRRVRLRAVGSQGSTVDPRQTPKDPPQLWQQIL